MGLSEQSTSFDGAGSTKGDSLAISNVPLRSLDADVVSRHDVDTAWIVTSLAIRSEGRDLGRDIAATPVGGRSPTGFSRRGTR